MSTAFLHSSLESDLPGGGGTGFPHPSFASNTNNATTTSDSQYVQQYLRSIIIHSLDTFNFNNAEFTSERLLAIDSTNPQSIYLYCLTLFKQGKFKSCYSKLINNIDLINSNLSCTYLFGQCCLKLKLYKEGIYQVIKLHALYNEEENLDHNPDNENNPYYFITSQQKFNYEFNRSMQPDSSMIHHLLGDLYKGINDIKNSALNYSQAVKYNQFDFEAFQELCKLGVKVRVKSIYKSNGNGFNIPTNGGDESIVDYNNSDNFSNPFSNSNVGETPIIHQDDSFTNLSTPRIRPTVVPDAPLRRSNLNTGGAGANLTSFEFTKPNFPNVSDTINNSMNEKKPTSKRESAYSRITSRLTSLPGTSSTTTSNSTTSSSNNPNVSNSKILETPGKKSNIRSTLKRNTSSSMMDVGNHTTTNNNNNANNNNNNQIIMNKEIIRTEKYLFKLYIIFAKAFKCMSKYDCYKGIRLLESLPENEKETPWVLSKLGRLNYEIINYKQSDYYFMRLRKLDRTRLEDMEYYSTLLWHLHRKVELSYLANELYDLNNESSITWCVIGNLFSLIREPDEAIKCFNKAISKDEDFTYGYTLKGHEYFSNDNYEMALENFRISLLKDSRHYNALYGIGMVYINLGDYQKADYHFRKALSINPINIILICCVGMVLEKLNKKSLALKQYDLANKLQPLNPLPIFKKAQLLFSMQNFQQSLINFEKLKDLAPQEASVHFLLGQLYNIQNDKFQAIREFTIALNLDPKGNYLIREAMESLKEK
ncbi:hypothetical protein DFJ63DRAFT_104480 [Scheffersomyces coipomensis]|uniref:uncharacterized protein n=1 Tax=Scheffersomyces coipomensis TaxID=1788519 RepID=UPI00315DB4EB